MEDDHLVSDFESMAEEDGGVGPPKLEASWTTVEIIEISDSEDIEEDSPVEANEVASKERADCDTPFLGFSKLPKSQDPRKTEGNPTEIQESKFDANDIDIDNIMVDVESKSHFDSEIEEVKKEIEDGEAGDKMAINVCKNCFTVRNGNNCSQCDGDKRVPSFVSCQLCTKRFADMNVLMAHITEQHLNSGTGDSESLGGRKRRRAPRCGICLKGFTEGEQLKLHMVEVHGYEIVNDQSDEDDEYTENPEVKVKIEEIVSDKFSCKRCPQSFKTPFLLGGHTRSQHPKTPQTANSKEHKTDSRPRPFVCKVCNMDYLRNRDLVDHMRRKHKLPDTRMIKNKFKPRPYVCELCHFDYTSISHLNEHIRNKHPNLYAIKIAKLIKKRSGLSLQNRINRIKDSTIPRPFVCKICCFDYTNASSLKVHMRKKHRKNMDIPTGSVKQEQLEVVEKGNQQEIKKIRRINPTKPRPFVCSICSLDYMRQHDLNQHKMTKHFSIYKLERENISKKPAKAPATNDKTATIKTEPPILSKGMKRKRSVHSPAMVMGNDFEGKTEEHLLKGMLLADAKSLEYTTDEGRPTKAKLSHGSVKAAKNTVDVLKITNKPNQIEPATHEETPKTAKARQLSSFLQNFDAIRSADLQIIPRKQLSSHQPLNRIDLELIPKTLRDALEEPPPSFARKLVKPTAIISYPCALCSHRYHTPASLKKHVSIAHNRSRKVYTCKKCISVHTGARSLTNHMLEMHTTQISADNRDSEKPPVDREDAGKILEAMRCQFSGLGD